MIERVYRKACKAAAYPLGLTPFMGTITSVRAKKPSIALTFDDGPDPKWTPVLLDLLKTRGVKATFFVIGASCEKYPGIINRAVSEGHSICNHGWSHSSLPMLSRVEQVQEILKCKAVLGERGSNFFRPPYGHQTFRSRWAARVASQHVVTWSGHVEDWRKQSVEGLYQRLLSELVPGAIILLHDAIVVGPGVVPGPDLQMDRGVVFDALDLVLAKSSARFEFVTLPDLIQQGRPKRESWYAFSKSVA